MKYDAWMKKWGNLGRFLSLIFSFLTAVFLFRGWWHLGFLCSLPSAVMGWISLQWTKEIAKKHNL